MNNFLILSLKIWRISFNTFGMTRVVHDLDTNRYLRHGRWTVDRTKAEHFTCFEEAISACNSQNLRHLELVLQLDLIPNDAYDIHVPLS